MEYGRKMKGKEMTEFSEAELSTTNNTSKPCSVV
jgi:hypothetical protein